MALTTAGSEAFASQDARYFVRTASIHGGFQVGPLLRRQLTRHELDGRRHKLGTDLACEHLR
jgi:hypothetical protein